MRKPRVPAWFTVDIIEANDAECINVFNYVITEK